MVVDDDESVNSFLTFSLKQEGFEVISVFSAEDGLKKLATQIPALILLDVMLPNMDGFAMTKKIREDEKFQHTPILLITAYAQEQKVNLARTKEVGAQGFIEKPIMFDELLVQITDAITGRFSVPTRLKYSA